MSTATSWTAWHRAAGRAWVEVGSDTTEAEAWRQLLEALPCLASGDSTVLPAGKAPPATGRHRSNVGKAA
jgi:hypothetical protein